VKPGERWFVHYRVRLQLGEVIRKVQGPYVPGHPETHPFNRAGPLGELLRAELAASIGVEGLRERRST